MEELVCTPRLSIVDGRVQSEVFEIFFREHHAVFTSKSSKSHPDSYFSDKFHPKSQQNFAQFLLEVTIKWRMRLMLYLMCTF